MRNKKMSLLISLNVLIVAGILNAENSKFQTDIENVINHLKNYSPEQKQQLSEIAQKELEKSSAIACDKSERMKKDLAVMITRYGNVSQCNQKEFEVIMQAVKIDLNNYSKLPPLTKEDYSIIQNNLQNLKDAVADFINSAYSDCPQDIKQQIVQKFSENFDKQAVVVGSYSNPVWLYPREISKGKITELLPTMPALTNLSGKYTNMLKPILDSPSWPEEAKKQQKASFAQNEASPLNLGHFIFNLRDLMFDKDRLYNSGFQNKPDELKVSLAAIGKKLDDIRKEEYEKEVKKMKHENFVRNVLSDTGIEMIDGNVILDDSYLSELEKESTQKQVEGKLFYLPTVDKCKEARTPFILNLQSEKLEYFDLPNGENNQPKSYSRIDIGDLAWNGVLITTNSADASTILQESKRPLESMLYGNVGFHELPKDIQMPYSFLVATKEGANYLIKIQALNSDGIKISYRLLQSEEIKKYKSDIN